MSIIITNSSMELNQIINEMSARFPRGMPHTLILLSPLKEGSGNYSTINRIRQHLQSHSYACHLRDPLDFSNLDDFGALVERNNIGVLVGIHALRTGAFMKESNLPYILVLGGTDIHVFCGDLNSMTIMTEAVYKARFVVAFNDYMQERALDLWPDLCPSRIKVISQAVETNPSSFDIHQCLEGNGFPCVQSATNNAEKPIIFLLVAGIRPVKNPVYLISAFQEWHAKDHRILLLIVGPKLNQEYVSSVFEPALNRGSGVVYLSSLPAEDVHAAMLQSFCVLNTSDSEGMCLTILEAMQLGVIVMARDIPANRALIQEGNTGMLFDSPESFQEKAQILLEDDDYRQQMVKNAKTYVEQHHSIESERQRYGSLLTTVIQEIGDGPS